MKILISDIWASFSFLHSLIQLICNHANSTGSSSDVLDADGAISDRLVSFKDVQELQTRNSELLMVIREVTAKQEASEAKLVEERTADLKKAGTNIFQK